MEDHKSLPVLDGQLQVDTSFVLDNCYAAEGDAVIMAGSLVEGMGNRYSDLDVYVFCESPKLSSAVNLDGHYRVISNARKIVRDRDGDCEVMLVHTVLPQSGVKVDVEFKTYRELAQLQVRVDEIFAYARQNLVLLSQRLSFREESLMHRLFTGTVLLGAQKLEDFRSGFSKAKYCYLAYRWSASDFSVLLDLMGSWAQG